MGKMFLVLGIVLLFIAGFGLGALSYHSVFANKFMEIPYTQGLMTGSSALLYVFQKEGACDANYNCTINFHDANQAMTYLLNAGYLAFISTDWNFHGGVDSQNCWFVKDGSMQDMTGEYQRGSPRCKKYYEEYDKAVLSLPSIRSELYNKYSALGVDLVN